MTAPPPSVSIVVRSIGRPTLARALASIAAQDHPAIEIVIVAASGSAHPALPGAIGSCRIVEVRPPDRLPRAEAADAGIHAATGDWITFLDDDDELLPGHISGLMAAAAADPAARAVTGRALATFRNGRTEIWGQRFALSELYARNFVHLSTLLFQRSLLAHGLAFDPKLHLHEDWDLALQIAQHTRFADYPQATFRWHADAGTSGGGGGGNVAGAEFARLRDYVYAKWAAASDAHFERCGALLNEAAAAAGAGRLDAAVAAARGVLAISQNDPHALNLLSMLALRQGDGAAALAHQALAVAVRPGDPDLLCNLALVLLGRGDEADARAALYDALAADPAHARAQALLREMGQAGPPGARPLRQS